MKTFKVLVAVRTATMEVSKSDNRYYKLEVEQFASKESNSSVWTNEQLCSSVKGTKKVTSLFRVSETFFKLWLKGKTNTGNMLILTVEEHIAGITEYLDKDNQVKVHGADLIESGSLIEGDITLDINEVQQCIPLDLAVINGKASLNGDLTELLPIMIQSIQFATRTVNNNLL